MMTRIKHILILMSLLISVSQSAHILGHVYKDHEKSNNELVHINDHKCQLCHADVNTLLPTLDDVSFVCFPFIKHQQKSFFTDYLNTQYTTSTLLLRGPPTMI